MVTHAQSRLGCLTAKKIPPQLASATLALEREVPSISAIENPLEDLKQGNERLGPAITDSELGNGG